MTLLDELAVPRAPELPRELLDRSTLERYSVCPYQGWAAETGRVTIANAAMDCGGAVHDVISMAIADYARDGIPPREMLQTAIAQVERTDIQPDAIEALRRSVYGINAWVTDRHPSDFIAFDGGEGARSGQLSAEILPAVGERPAQIATSELDVLVATPAPTVYQEVDWKTGHKWHAPAKVRDSFQFSLHAWLVFRVWPECEQLDVVVWMTRFNVCTGAIPFRRGRWIDQFTGCLQAIAENRRVALAADVPDGWPDPEKCLGCDASGICPHIHSEAARIGEDPRAFVTSLDLRRMQAEKDLVIAANWVEAHGPIPLGDGQAWGVPPKKAARPRAPSISSYGAYALHSAETADNGDEGEDD